MSSLMIRELKKMIGDTIYLLGDTTNNADKKIQKVVINSVGTKLINKIFCVVGVDKDNYGYLAFKNLKDVEKYKQLDKFRNELAFNQNWRNVSDEKLYKIKKILEE